MVGFLTASADKASTMVYCLQVDHPRQLHREARRRASDARGSTAWNADEPCRPGGSDRQALTYHAASLAGIDRDGQQAISAGEEEARGVIAPRRGNLACRCPDHTRQAAARGRRGTAGEPPQGGAHVAPDKGLTHLICINVPIAPWHQSKRLTLAEPDR